MLTIIFSFAFFLCASGLLVLSARSDWNGMKIPNEFSLALIGLFLFGVILPNSIFPGIKLFPGLIGGGAVFLVTMILYVGKAMGGGDTKLASAVALLVGVEYIGVFLLIMALSGGLLGVYALLCRKYAAKLLPTVPAPETWLAQLKDGQNKVPYGLAIASGGIATLAVKWLGPYIS